MAPGTSTHKIHDRDDSRNYKCVVAVTTTYNQLSANQMVLQQQIYRTRNWSHDLNELQLYICIVNMLQYYWLYNTQCLCHSWLKTNKCKPVYLLKKFQPFFCSILYQTIRLLILVLQRTYTKQNHDASKSQMYFYCVYLLLVDIHLYHIIVVSRNRIHE